MTSERSGTSTVTGSWLASRRWNFGARSNKSDNGALFVWLEKLRAFATWNTRASRATLDHRGEFGKEEDGWGWVERRFPSPILGNELPAWAPWQCHGRSRAEHSTGAGFMDLEVQPWIVRMKRHRSKTMQSSHQSIVAWTSSRAISPSRPRLKRGATEGYRTSRSLPVLYRAVAANTAQAVQPVSRPANGLMPPLCRSPWHVWDERSLAGKHRQGGAASCRRHFGAALAGAAQPEPGKESHAKQEGPSSVLLVCMMTRQGLTVSATVSAAETIVEGGATASSADSGALASKRGGTGMDPSLGSLGETGSPFFQSSGQAGANAAPDDRATGSPRVRTELNARRRGERDRTLVISHLGFALSSAQFAAGRAQTERALRVDLPACREIRSLGTRNRAELSACLPAFSISLALRFLARAEPSRHGEVETLELQPGASHARILGFEQWSPGPAMPVP
ncbi:hypothetical protein PHYSODRAFT_302267 [Phytophthora sojae]|uniref:Uncharacterized protein n=1 Tax=Phytophthora sojae (strain P6497) TaxID=1094619 RepID=G4ZPR0_PHYSP|nr:hypothetical protein PHYSODRAFT_302267 [Phytophthora sojae]EGZ15850.1 hypothetical protein PHYSODRAFT_302267 [Phytophthora sojae]|eukprot:XP_009529599.1 hypothetical protein PHYSODRAFT_302267 [Phytophthora sojae]